MKNILKLFTLLIVLVFTSCDDKEYVTINEAASTTLTASATNLVLESENEGTTVLTLNWTEPSYNYESIDRYKIYIDLAGNGFANANIRTVNNTNEISFLSEAINSLVFNLGALPGEPTDIEIMVEAFPTETGYDNYVGATSNTITVNITPYTDVLDLTTTWGIVGSAAPNGWDGPDVPFYQTGENNVLVAYTSLTEGEIKFRENNSWDLNYGDDGADGTLEVGGANIVVTEGTYKITFNLNDLTYTIEPYTWGLVGSATTNGWDGPDMPLEYDPTSDQWRALVTLADGEIKFRQNNDWGVNYGDDELDGILENGGANIAVTAGNYLVTLNLNDLTYAVEEVENIWGLVGSATPNGWDGPDFELTMDYANEGVWYTNSVDLIEGEIKFRANNDWGINYGDDGADGTLEDGAANIVIEASGNYSVILDLSDSENPTYTLTLN